MLKQTMIKLVLVGLLLLTSAMPSIASDDNKLLSVAFKVGECNTVLEVFNGAINTSSSEIRHFVRSYVDVKSAAYNVSTQEYLDYCGNLVKAATGEVK
jgi:hypothetical protein